MLKFPQYVYDISFSALNSSVVPHIVCLHDRTVEQPFNTPAVISTVTADGAEQARGQHQSELKTRIRSAEKAWRAEKHKTGEHTK